MSIWKDRKQHYIDNKNIILAGKVNCIPFPFPRFRNIFPGIQQSKLYGITGVQKSAKSQLALYLFCLQPLWYAFNNPNHLKVKVLYFSIEMGKEQLMDRIIGYWLYMISEGRITLSTQNLNSLNSSKPLPDEALRLMDTAEFQTFMDYIEDNLFIHNAIRNPTGIFKECVNFAVENGKVTYKNYKYTDNLTGKTEERKAIDSYSKNDPNEYHILIVDHVSLLTPEKAFGGQLLNLRETITKFSNNDCIILRDLYKYAICNVQQQSLEKEGNESFKLDRMSPSSDGLADSKNTSKDFNTLFGIYNPHKYKVNNYHGYDITKFKKQIRFLEIIENREGEGNETIALYFNGAVNYFEELPKPSDPNLNAIMHKYNIN
jgi:hypothetical protein